MALAGDWRSGSENVIEAWGNAIQMGRFTDVTFLVEYEDVKQVFQAHKCVLAFGSPVFESMFYGPMQERNNSIKIVGVNPAAFENLLRFFYADSIDLEDLSCAFDTYVAAERYDVPQLRTACDDFISEVVNDDSACPILTKALFFNMSKAKETSLNYISENAERLLLSEEFNNVSLDAVHKILQCRRLEISECRLLYALTEWAVANNENGSLKELLKEIHFDKIRAKDFCKFIEDYPDVLPTADALALLKHTLNPIYKKPDWCSNTVFRKAIEKISILPNNIYANNAVINDFRVYNTVGSALDITTSAPEYNAIRASQSNPVHYPSDLSVPADFMTARRRTRDSEHNHVHDPSFSSMPVLFESSIGPSRAPEYNATLAPQGNPVHYRSHSSMREPSPPLWNHRGSVQWSDAD